MSHFTISSSSLRLLPSSFPSSLLANHKYRFHRHDVAVRRHPFRHLSMKMTEKIGETIVESSVLNVLGKHT